MNHRNTVTEFQSQTKASSKRPSLERHTLSRDIPSENIDMLGPDPQRVVEAYVDLGLSNEKIARYFRISEACVVAIRAATTNSKENKLGRLRASKWLFDLLRRRCSSVPCYQCFTQTHSAMIKDHGEVQIAPPSAMLCFRT